MKRLGVVLLCVLSMWGVPSSLVAQTTTATILGTVTDATGGLLPGTTVTVTNVETGIQRSLVVDAEGRYRASNLAPGDYEVSAELPGFRSEVRRGIRLTIGREATVNFKLLLAELKDTIVVTGEASLVETTKSDIGGLVSTEQVATLPLNSRDFSQLITLQAGATQYRAPSGGVQAGFGTRISVSGARTNMNAFSLDGANVNTASGQLPSGVGQATLGVEAMREFKVLTGNYSAEYGRAAGANIIAVTKSGTNRLHGSLFEYHRNDTLDAPNYFDQGEKPDFKRNQFGFSLGGPVVRDKAFFFASYEGLRETLGQTAIGGVPTAAARQGILPDRTVAVDPEIVPYLELWPLPNGRDRGDGTAEYIQITSQPTDHDYMTGRVDYQLSNKHSMFARWTVDRSSRINPDALGLFSEELTTDNRYGTFQFQNIFSPKLVGVARIGYNRDFSEHQHFAEIALDPALSFIEGRPFGSISVSGVSGLTGMSSGITPYISDMKVPQFNYSLSYTAGRHSLKAGASVERMTFDRTQDQLTGGAVSFGSLESFLTNGQPSRFRMKGPDTVANPTRHFRQTITAFYIQDDWSIRDDLTLNLGVRHDYTTSPTETEGRLANIRYVMDSASTVGEPYFKNPQAKNFAPRLGFVWTPGASGNTSVRGGFGIFYEPLASKQYLITMVLQPPFWSAPDPLRPQLGGLFPNVTQERLVELAKGPESVHAFDFEPESPRMYHASLSVQRMLVEDLVLTATYTGTWGRNLVSRRDFNVPEPEFLGGGNCVVEIMQCDGEVLYPLDADYLNPNFGRYHRYGTWASSEYHGLLTSVNKRYRNGVQFQLSYTFSKNMDTQSAHFAGEAGGNSHMNPFNPMQDWGPANTDVRHNFSGNFIYDLPFGQDAQGLVGRLIGGWRVSGILALATGLPFTVTSDQSLTHPLLQEGNVRPDLSAGASLNPVLGGPEQYFDPSGFEVQRRGFYGNVGRNTLRGPGFASFDLSLIKNIRIGDRHKLQFRSEFFNLFNRANFNPPASNLFDSAGRRIGSAGRITSTSSTARQIQLAVRYEF